MEYYRSFHVGGNPDRIAFLADELNKEIRSLQSEGWIIDDISPIDNTRAWSANKQMYVSTKEYIIIAKKWCVEELTESEFVRSIKEASDEEIQKILKGDTNG